MNKYRRLVVISLSLMLALTTFSLVGNIGFAAEEGTESVEGVEQETTQPSTVQENASEEESDEGTSEQITEDIGAESELQDDAEIMEDEEPVTEGDDTEEDALKPLLKIKIPDSEKEALKNLRADQPVTVHVAASNPSDESVQMRIFSWKYNEEFYDKSLRKKASEADRTITLKDIDDKGNVKVKTDKTGEDVEISLSDKDNSRSFAFNVPAETEYEFDVALIPEKPEELSENVRIILEPSAEENAELTEEEFKDSLIDLKWEPVEKVEKAVLKAKAASDEGTIVRSEAGRVRVVQEAMLGGDGADKRRTTIAIKDRTKTPDENTVYQYKTGQSASYTIAVSNEDNTAVEDVIRVYFDYSGIDYGMGSFPVRDTPYTIHNVSGTDYSMKVKQCKDSNGNPLPGKYYYELTGIVPGETLAFENGVLYNSPESAGGTLKIWTTSMSKKEAEATDGSYVEPYSWLELQWTTDPVSRTVSKTNASRINSSSVKTHFEGDGSGDDTVYLKKLGYQITETAGTGHNKSEGEDLIRSVDYTDTLSLPDAAFWREGLIEAIENGNYRVQGGTADSVLGNGQYGYTIYVTINGTEYKLASVVDNAFRESYNYTTYGVKNLKPVITSTNGTKTVQLQWHCDNQYKTANTASLEYPVKTFSVVYGDSVIGGSLEQLNEQMDEGTNPSFVNTVKEDREYSWSKRQTAEGSVSKEVSLDASMNATKSRDNSNSTGGTSNPYTITVWNDGIANLKNWGYKESNGTVRSMVEDTIPYHQYITPADIEKLLKSTEKVGNKTYHVGDWVDLTISPATLCTVNAGNETSEGQELFAEDNTTKDKYTNGVPAKDETALTTAAVLNLKNVNGKLTLTVSNSGNANKDGSYVIGEGGDYATVEEAFNAIGYEVTRGVYYRLKWQPTESDNLVLTAGQRLKLHIPSTMKTTFMMLDGDTESYLTQYNYVSNTANIYANYGGSNHSLSRSTGTFRWIEEAYIYKSALNGSSSVNSNTEIPDGTVLDYCLNSYKTTTVDSYDKMPISDLSTGAQVVLAPQNANPDLKAPDGSALETFTDSYGIVYWLLNKEGTYKNVKLGSTAKVTSSSATPTYYTAETITVTKGSASLNTLVKWEPVKDWGKKGSSQHTYIYYKSLVSGQASGLIQEGDTTGQRFTLNNKCWLGDHQRHRLYDTIGMYFWTYGFNKYIAAGPADNPDSNLIKQNRINRGQTVTYRLPVTNKTDSDTILRGSNIYDALPQTRGVFEWTKANVTNLRYVTENASVHILNSDGTVADTWTGGLDGKWNGDGDSHWSIKTTGRQNNSVTTGQYFLNWDNDFAIKFKPGGTAYIYVDLTWPDDISTWEQFVEKNNGARVYNTFYLGENSSWRSSSVNHLPMADAKAVIRKGVYDTGWTTKGGSTTTWVRSYQSRGSRTTYSNSIRTDSYRSDYNLHNSTVTYYTEVYNGSNERLYLEPLQDKLPKGFIYDSMANRVDTTTDFDSDDYDHSYLGSHARDYTGYINSESYAAYSYATVDNSSDPKDNHTVQYVNFRVTEKTTKTEDGVQYLTFTLDNNSTNYDSEVGKYFLDPGQAVRFGYNILVGPYASTEDAATNTVAMPYYNYYGADFTLDDYEKLKPSTVNKLEANDGECEQMTLSEVEDNYGFDTSKYTGDKYNTEKEGNWLVSSVTVNREPIVPGVQKAVAGYVEKVVDATETSIEGSEGSSTNYNGNKNTLYGTKYTGGVTSSQIVNWRLRLLAEHNTMTDYTIVDTADVPYQFTGKVFYNLYYASGTGTRETSSARYLFTLGSRSEGDTKVRIGSGASLSDSYLQIGDAEDDTDDQWFTFGSGVTMGKVKIEKLDDGREQMTIRMIGSGLSIPEHRWMDLCVHTQFCEDKVVISEGRYNDIILKPTQDYSAQSVSQGRPLTHSETVDGKRITVNDGVESGASVMIVQGYTTSSIKHISEIGNSKNTANSDSSPNYIALSEKSKKFKYDLNITGPKAIMSKVVLIDALPEVGDHSAFVATDLRNSEFMVSLWAENPDFHVYVNRGGAGEKELSADKYTIEISTKHEFNMSDWNGKSTSDWVKLADATEAQLKAARSFRVIIEDPNAWQTKDSSLYIMPDDSNIHISFNADITDPAVEPGQTAWNSFGYYYTVPMTFDVPENQRVGIPLMAQPLSAGVKYPAAPKLTKKLVDEDGEAYQAKDNLTFGFIIYKGNSIASLNNAQNMTDAQIAEALGDREYIYVPVTVKKGSSEAEIAFYNENFNLAAYDAEKGWTDKMVDGHVQLLQWTGDEQFQVVELPFAGGQFKLKNIGNSDEDAVGNNYTFIQNLQSIIEFTSTNEYAPEMCQVKGSKEWSDDDDRDRVRPSEITVGLYANNEKIDEATVTEDDDWAFSFTNLTKYDENGNEIEYTLKEDKISDYTPSITYEKKDKTAEEVYTITGNITNTHTPAKTYVEVDKKWVDGGSFDKTRPEKVIVNLLADGEKTGDTIELSEENSWHDMFTDLNVNKDGVPIKYTIEEEKVKGYTTECSGNAEEGFLLTNTRDGLTTINCSKDWDDQNDKDGSRPGSIEIKLMADGVETATATANANSQWECSFTDLPRFNADGTKITYSIAETPVDGYAASYEIDGSMEDGNEVYECTITNFHEPVVSDGARTGDDFSMLTWCLLLLLSGAAIVGIPVLMRRRMQENE